MRSGTFRREGSKTTIPQEQRVITLLRHLELEKNQVPPGGKDDLCQNWLGMLGARDLLSQKSQGKDHLLLQASRGPSQDHSQAR
jgi:hypothetical protein